MNIILKAILQLEVMNFSHILNPLHSTGQHYIFVFQSQQTSGEGLLIIRLLFVEIMPNFVDNFLSFYDDNLVTRPPWQHLFWLSRRGEWEQHPGHICVVWTLLPKEGWQSCVTNPTSVALKENSHLRRWHLTPSCAPVSSNSDNNNTTHNNNNNGKRIEKSKRRHQGQTEEKLDLRHGYAACSSLVVTLYRMDFKLRVNTWSPPDGSFITQDKQLQWCFSVQSIRMLFNQISSGGNLGVIQLTSLFWHQLWADLL